MHESVLVAILDESHQNILLTKRRDIPVWVFPGGRVEDESPEQAAIRECEEETGYRVQIVRKIGEYTPRNRLSKFTHYFEARIIGGNPRISDETKAIDFFPLSKLPYPLPPPYHTMVEHAATNAYYTEEVPNSSYWYFITSSLKRPDLVLRFLLMKMGLHVNS